MTSFRMVLTSDWHLDASTGGIERREEIKQAVMRGPVKAAIEGKADLFAFLGDLCDPGGRSAVHDAAFPIRVWGYLKHRVPGMRQVWLAGNHDVVLTSTIRTTLDPLAEAAGAAVAVREPTVITSPGAPSMLIVPYVAAPARERHGWGDGERLRFEHTDAKPAIVLGHCTDFPTAIDPGSEEVEFSRGKGQAWPTELADGALFQANGHFHTPQEITLPGGKTVHVPGAMVRLTFHDAGEHRGFLIVDLEV